MSVRRSPRRVALWLPPIAFMMLIFYLSAQSDPLPEVTTRVWDKLLHGGAYALLGALLSRALFGEGLEPVTTLVLSVLLASLYGATDEYHQSFVPARHADIADWVVDTFGAAFGTIGHLLGLFGARRQ